MGINLKRNTMKVFKKIISVILLSFVMLGFSQCSSTKKLQVEAPITVGKVYCQQWVAGIQGGGSGLNIFISIGDTSILLDSVYFRGRAAKLETKPQDKALYIGRFISQLNQKRDIVMSSDATAEYGNKMPVTEKNIPFELKPDECVISYFDKKKIKYFKVTNVVEKALIPYPSAPPNKQ